jgi:hypothetical protein
VCVCVSIYIYIYIYILVTQTLNWIRTQIESENFTSCFYPEQVAIVTSGTGRDLGEICVKYLCLPCRIINKHELNPQTH